MTTNDWLADQFERHRPHLRGIALRMLGSPGDAEDAVQEAWLRLSRTDDPIHNLGGWLTTVLARICLNVLRSRRARPEQSLDDDAMSAEAPEHGGPADAVEMADAVGTAMLVVLETLEPAERLAFVLHDMFGVAFDDIANILERTPAATRQLASRARRRVRQGGGVARTGRAGQAARQRVVVEAFIAASRDGDFAALLAVLDPDVVLRADHIAVQTAAARQARGAPLLEPEMNGAETVAQAFLGRAGAAQPVLINGVVGAAWMPGGNLFAAFVLEIHEDRIGTIEIVVDKANLARLDVVPL